MTELFASPEEAASELAKGYASLTAEIERLRALVYRPGVMRCAKCSFRLVRNVFHVQSGDISAGDSKTEPCPNGCGPLWPVTWKDDCKEADILWSQQVERAFALRSQQVERAVAAEARLKAVSDAAGLGNDPRPNLAEAISRRIRALEGALRDLLAVYDAEDAGGNPLPLEHQAWDAPIDNARSTLAGFAPSVTPATLFPMSSAPKKDKMPISARVTSDESVLPERWRHSAGLWFTVRHGGILEDGFDLGWQYPGHGGIPDYWFEGWWPLPSGDIDPTAQSVPT